MGAPLEGEAILDPSDGSLPLFEYWRPTSTWISANLFRLLDRGVAAAVLREGDPRRGAVLLIFAGPHGERQVFEQVRTPDGHSQWMAVDDAPLLDEAAADRMARRAVARDPDLWILLIETEGLSAGISAGPLRPPEDVRVSIPDATALRVRALLRRHAQRPPHQCLRTTRLRLERMKGGRSR